MPKLLANIDGTGVAKGINFVDPTGAQDLATKAYVDAIAAGLEPKPAVAAVSTANVTKSGAQTIDGVSLSAGQRALLTGQTTGSENGIWVVAAGAWTRPTDFPAAGTASPGAYCLVEAGTLYRGTGWIMTGTTAVTIDTTSQTWQQFTGAGDLTATSPIVPTGNVVSLATVPVASGGTGATTAAGAKTNLGFATSSSGTIGDGSSNPITYTHNMGTKDVIVSVRRVSDDAIVDCDVIAATTNTITIGTAAVAATNALRVTVLAAP